MPIFALSLLWKKKVLYILYLNPKFIRNSLFDYNTYINKSYLTFQCSPWPLKSTQHKFHLQEPPCSCNPDKNNQIVLLLSLYGMYHYSQPVTTTDFVLVLS